MNEYHKINTIYKRDMTHPKKKIIIGDWSCPEFAYLAMNRWVFTEKVDGMNIRVMLKNGKVSFGGKTDNAQIPAQLIEHLQAKFLPLEAELATDFPKGVCLYGEGYGAGIQKAGIKYRPDKAFVMFDVRVGDWWLKQEDVTMLSNKYLIETVPFVGVGTLEDAVDLVATKGLESMWGNFPAEGIVARPEVELQTRSGARIIAKIKACDFETGE